MRHRHTKRKSRKNRLPRIHNTRFNIPQKNSEGEQIQVGAWCRLLPGLEPRHDEIIQIRTPRRAPAQRWLLQN